MSKCKAEHKVMKLPDYTKHFRILPEQILRSATHTIRPKRLNSLLLPLLSNERFVNVRNDTFKHKRIIKSMQNMQAFQHLLHN